VLCFAVVVVVSVCADDELMLGLAFAVFVSVCGCGIAVAEGGVVPFGSVAVAEVVLASGVLVTVSVPGVIVVGVFEVDRQPNSASDIRTIISIVAR
jgi:hypothetical protein